MTDRTKTICPPIFDLGGIKIRIFRLKMFGKINTDFLIFINEIQINKPF